MFVRVHVYTVAPRDRARFEAAYGPDGDWARLFSPSGGYLGTTLESDAEGRYRTQDSWTSRSAFEAFLEERRKAYDALDRACAPLKLTERHEGDYAHPRPEASRWSAVPGAERRAVPKPGAQGRGDHEGE